MNLFFPAAIVLLNTGALLAVDFKKDIQPILKAECYKCHSEAEGKEKGGFVFDNLERFAKDIGPGKSIEPGSIKESHFYETLVGPVDDEAHMPPKKMLAEASVAKIKQWIEEGASLDGSKRPMAEAPAAPPTSSMPARPTMQSWSNSEGRVIQAALVRVEGDNVIFLMPNGQQIPYPLAKLSPDSQAKAKGGN